MSWITVIWSMASAGCATFAVIHLAIWFERRSQVAHLLFALSALGAAGNGLAELVMLKAATVEGYALALRALFVPLTILVISTVWYACTYFGNCRRYLAGAVTFAWLLVLIIDAFSPFSPIFSEISGLRMVRTPWGETFALAKGTISPLNHILNLADLMLLVFIVDGSLTLWRRGNRRRALWVGGGIAAALLMAIILTRLVDAGVLHIPYVITFVYMGIVLVSGFPLSADVFRAALLERRLRASEGSLRESEERMRLAVDAANLGLWEWDVSKDELWGTEARRALLGLPASGRITLEEALSRVHVDDRDRLRQTLMEAVRTGKDYSCEYRVVLPDGSTRWTEHRGRCVRGVHSKNLVLRGVSMDVTEHKRAEEKFRLAVEASPNGIVLVNQTGQIVLVNTQVEKLFGYDREELIGNSVEILVPDRFASHHPEHRARFFAAPTTRAMGAGRELFGRKKDGSEFPVEIGLNPIQTPGGVLVLAAVVDISARKRSEAEARRHAEELSHLSRVAVLGEMSASIAHELNQPLSGIVSNAAAGQRFIDRGNIDLHELRELLGDIIVDGRRASDVIRGIRSMVKKEQTARQRVDLNEVVRQAVQIASPDALLRSCEVRTSLDPNLPTIEGDPVQLQQVLLNLVINAFDAMRDIPVRDRTVVIATESNGDGTIGTSVRDYGVGIAKETRDRLFDPFFTTKSDGLGMGLAIVRSIVESHGGKIAVENVEGGGARFSFILPTSPKSFA